MSRIVVLKIGGSLLDWPALPARLTSELSDRVGRSERPLLLGGGGAAADAVRALDRVHHLDPAVSHDLALRSLDLTAAMIAAIVEGVVPIHEIAASESVWCAGRFPILAPRLWLEADEHRFPEDALPHSWDCTSDAIAAHLAHRLGAGLVLFKSAPVPPHLTHDADGLARLGLVDPVFPKLAEHLAWWSIETFRVESNAEPGIQENS